MAFNIIEIDGVKIDPVTKKFPVEFTAEPHSISGQEHYGQLEDNQIPISIMRNEYHLSDPHTMLIDGRDVSVDGAKLDSIESGAEVNNLSDMQAADLTSGLHTSWHNHDLWYYTKTQLQTPGLASVVWNNITNKPETYPSSIHDHNDIYFTKSEITLLLDNKSDITHLHDSRYFTQEQLTGGTLDSRYYTEAEIDEKIYAASIGVQGAVDTYNNLPSIDLNAGVIYIVRQTVGEFQEGFYQWNGSNWVFLVNNTGVETHNSLAGINEGEYLHLTSSQYDQLTSSIDTNLHTHNSIYFTEDEITATYYSKSQMQTSGSSELHWDNITNKPTSYTPSIHNQSASTITSGTLSVARGGTGKSSFVLDKIIIFNGTQLSSSLYGFDDIALIGHNHASLYYTQDELNNGQLDSRYFTETEITSLLLNKSDTAHLHDDRYFTETEITALLSNKSNIDHLHDDRYFTETEITAILSNKSDVNHLHDDRYFTETEITAFLLNKSDVNHLHDDRYYTKTNLQTSGSATIHWDNITNKPTIGGNNWIEPVLLRHTGTLPSSGYSSGDKIIWNTDNNIYTYNGSSWILFYTPLKNDTVMVSNDGDLKPAQYWFDGASWIKIADPDYSDHGSLGGLLDDDHTQYLTSTRHTAIAGNPHNTTLNNIITSDATITWTKAQLDSLLNGSDVSLHNHNAIYYTKSEINTLTSNITFATISTNDPLTNITANELEMLTNGSNADGLHTHSFSVSNITLDSVYGQYGNGRTITVDNGPVELSATGGFAPLSLPQIDYTPTQWLSGGQICFRNGELYYYDGSRGKWLSVSETSFVASSNSTTATGYLYIGSTQMNATLGFEMPWDGTIVGCAYANGNASSSGQMFVAINGTNAATLYYNGLTSHDNNMNVNFSAGSVLQLTTTAYSSGGRPNRPIVSIFVRKRI